MKNLAIVGIGFLFASSAFAAPSFSAGCAAGIKQDLLRAGYEAKSIKLIGQKKGNCDGETCNSDLLKFRVKASARSGLVDLIVEASGPARGDDTCRVLSARRDF